MITAKQIISKLYKPTTAITIEKSNTDKIIKDMPQSFKWNYNSYLSGNNFIDDRIEIEGIEKSCFDLFVSKHTLEKMLENKLLTEEFINNIQEQIDIVENKAYDVEKKIAMGKYKITKLDCYLWIHSNGKFLGVYFGKPEDLINTVLNNYQTFTCISCGKSEKSNMFPDMYYDVETHDCYCPNCMVFSGKEVRHLGE